MMLQRIRAAAYPLYEKLPPKLKGKVRGVYGSMHLLSSKHRWIRNVYTQHGLAERRRVFLDIARFAHINRPIEGYYFEFGSHEANTMRLAWDCFHNLFDWTYVAFDSFQGLPAISSIDEQEVWEEGKLKTDVDSFLRICRKHGIELGKLKTVAGFYNETLTEELKAELKPKKAAVVYVDCDLYLSTVPVLSFIKDFLQPGTVVVFDDWNCFLGDPSRGERRAWAEFLEREPDLHFEDFVSNGMQKAFIYIGKKSQIRAALAAGV